MPLLQLSYCKITFRHLISTVSNYHVETLMVTDFYFLQMFTSPQFLEFDSLIYFYSQADYGSELGYDYKNTICKPDLIQISPDYTS